MKNKTKNLILIIALCFFVAPIFASAYTLLEPLPLSGGQQIEGVAVNAESIDSQDGVADVTFTGYLLWFFRFGLAAAAFLAVLQITIAGVQMIYSGASEKAQGDAKGRINDALWGLALAFTAWLILFTINPDLAQMKLDIKDLGEGVAPAQYTFIFIPNGSSIVEAAIYCRDLGDEWRAVTPAEINNCSTIPSPIPPNGFENFCCVNDGRNIEAQTSSPIYIYEWIEQSPGIECGVGWNAVNDNFCPGAETKSNDFLGKNNCCSKLTQ